MAMQQMISSGASSLASSMKKYDVFLSFRGEDTRRNFTSHLYDALSRKKIRTFKDDNELEIGDEISPALIEAIEKSHVSIVIFSKNYAFSKWCLAELTKVLECKKNQGQIVIPVFYDIDPTDVRNQKGGYAQAFANHERNSKLNKDKLQKWKSALTEAANLVGWDSQTHRTEPEFIMKIVEDVLLKLKPRYPLQTKELIGIEENYVQLESLLNIGSNEVRIIGIWGMGGIGKTTLVEVLYARLSAKFESCCFLANVREESNKYGLNVLRNKLYSTLLEEENHRLDAPYVDSSFLRTRIARLKALVVLDDVATLKQLNDLIIDINCPGSRVIVTARDKHIFSQVDEIYEVKKLDFHHSLQLFCLNAFGEKHPTFGYEELSRSAMAYCRGIPLALEVLGKSLRSRSKNAFESELKKLQKIPNEDIHNVLRLSYDDLDRTQKDIFLDIACFLNGEPRYHVESLLEACDFFPASGIEVLLDKTLVTISESNRIDMHDLVQEMGHEIVIRESPKNPGQRTRIWIPEEVFDVLKYKKGTEAVEGITFDASKVGTLNLSSDSFKNLPNLRYLKVHYGHKNSIYDSCENVYLPDGLLWLPEKFRYLEWNGFCLESFPSNFCAEKLVELSMPNSKLKKLWDGVQNLPNLKLIVLRRSKNLIEIPDLSRAANLRGVYLGRCTSLSQLHPSILSSPKLAVLSLYGCKKFEGIKSIPRSKSFHELHLANCSPLTNSLAKSEQMTTWFLNGATICELSSSTWCEGKLTYLCLSGPEKVSLAPIGEYSDNNKLKYINRLDLEGCTQINAVNLQFILDGMRSLEELDLTECSNLESLPNNIKKLSKLKVLYADDCFKLASIPELPPSLKHISLINCTSLEGDLLDRLIFDQTLPSKSFISPGDEVPSMFDFHSARDTLTIPPIPKSGLCGFLLCIVLRKGVDFDNERRDYYCRIDERIHKQHYSSNFSPSYWGKLCSHHVLYWYAHFEPTSEIDYCTKLSFDFEFEVERDASFTAYGIKWCGVLPVYASDSFLMQDGRSSRKIVELESDASDDSFLQDGGSCGEMVELESDAQISGQVSQVDINELETKPTGEIVEFESDTQIFDHDLQVSINELETESIAGGIRGLNCENKDHREQLLPTKKCEDLNENASCVCFIGLLLKNFMENIAKHWPSNILGKSKE